MLHYCAALKLTLYYKQGHKTSFQNAPSNALGKCRALQHHVKTVFPMDENISSSYPYNIQKANKKCSQMFWFILN